MKVEEFLNKCVMGTDIDIYVRVFIFGFECIVPVHSFEIGKGDITEEMKKSEIDSISVNNDVISLICKYEI